MPEEPPQARRVSRRGSQQSGGGASGNGGAAGGGTGSESLGARDRAIAAQQGVVAQLAASYQTALNTLIALYGRCGER